MSHKKKKAVLDILSSLGKDFLYVYQNFFHWTASKIIIAGVSFLVGILFLLPFFIVFGILAWIDGIDWTKLFIGFFQGNMIGLELISQFFSHPVFFIVEILLLFLGTLAFLLGYNYGTFLNFRLYLSYAQRNPIALFRREYFQKSKMFSYAKLALLFFGFIIIPLLVFLLLSFVIYLFLFFGILSADMFSNLLFLLLILALLCSAYLVYRLYFSFVVLADTTDHQRTAFSYIKESFHITHGWEKLGKILVYFALFNLILTPFTYVAKSIDIQKAERVDYLAYTLKQQTDIPEEEQFYASYLSEKFA